MIIYKDEVYFGRIGGSLSAVEQAWPPPGLCLRGWWSRDPTGRSSGTFKLQNPAIQSNPPGGQGCPGGPGARCQVQGGPVRGHAQ